MSKRERKAAAYYETYRRIEQEQGGKCLVCGKPMVQLAHKIPQDRANKRIYGLSVLHHRKNLVGVCGLACNDAVSISNHPVEEAKLVDEILDDIEGKPAVVVEG